MESTFTFRTLISCLKEAADGHADLEALHVPARGRAEEISLSFREMWRQVALFASGLVEIGLKEGENVLILSENRYRWLLTDLALQGLGCPGVPRGTEAPADEIDYIVDKVKARVVVVEQLR